MNDLKADPSNELWSVTISFELNWKFHGTWEKKSFVTAQNLQSIKTFLIY